MPDPDLFDEASGEFLALADYRDDFAAREAAGRGQASWKLERRQVFREPGNESWEAFARGDWSEALRLAEQRRGSLAEYQATVDAQRNTLYRVRVVEEPIAPYLQWELNLLRVRAEVGENIRIIGPEKIADRERIAALPELITLGSHTLYKIVYTDEGVLDGGIRITDPESVAKVTELAEELYRGGEEIDSFFERRVAHLPPPKLE
ncbi:DUF6879 family protein [Embleya sp. NPDC050154]|uniref:DUF6879 family protein n=1 Tax=unclassified Embleya TaxID=2699296 RepID=UPI0037878DB4